MKLNSCSKFFVFDFKKKEKNVSNIDMCWEKKDTRYVRRNGRETSGKEEGVSANMAQDSISGETETLVAWLFGRVIVRAEAYYWPR